MGLTHLPLTGLTVHDVWMGEIAEPVCESVVIKLGSHAVQTCNRTRVRIKPLRGSTSRVPFRNHCQGGIYSVLCQCAEAVRAGQHVRMRKLRSVEQLLALRQNEAYTAEAFRIDCATSDHPCFLTIALWCRTPAP